MSSLGTELKINVHLDRLDGYRMSYVKKQMAEKYLRKKEAQ